MILQINHTERQARMGASDAPAALGLSPFCTEYELAGLKTGRIEPDHKDTKSTRSGRRWESTILDIAEDELGPLARGEVVYAKGLDFPLASTLDGRVLASGVPVEAKSTGIEGPVFGEWGEADSDVVPPYYLVQCVVQMICTEADRVHLYALIAGRGVVHFLIPRDEEVCREITERLSRWWQRHVIEGVIPAQTEPIPLEVVKRFRRQPSKVIELYPEDLQTVAEFESARSLKLSAEKSCEAAQAKLLLLLGDAEAGRLPDGRELTYLPTTRKSYTVDETTFRTLRIRKGRS